MIHPAEGEVALHEPAPALLLPLAPLGEAVPRQIHQIEAVVDQIVVDQPGLAGRGADPGQLPVAGQAVDEAGFAHVAPAHQGDLRPLLGVAPREAHAGEEGGLPDAKGFHDALLSWFML